ncbi:MAG: tape measure protein, partial [Deltaproteobacteria bacterium]|nr:tape measure protein [Deltaproteobacteria bacterium]
MTTEVDRVIVKIQGDVTDLQAKMGQARASVNSFRKGMALMRNALVATAAAAVALRGAMAAINTQEIFAKSEARIRLLTKSSQEFEQVQKDLIDVSMKSGVRYGELIKLYSRFGMASQRLGVDQKSLVGITQLVSDTFRISGSTMQEATGSAIQFAQAIASNRLGGEELRSVMENNLRLTKLLADELSGGDLGKFRADAKSGLLDTEALINAMVKNIAKIRSEAALIPVELAESIGVAADQFQLGFSEGATEKFRELGEALRDPATIKG